MNNWISIVVDNTKLIKNVYLLRLRYVNQGMLIYRLSFVTRDSRNYKLTLA